MLKRRGRCTWGQDFICYLFPLVPGVEIAERNGLNVFGTEEVGVALWNDRHPRGLYFLPHLLLVECKNWSHACGSQEVSYLINRLRQRGCDHGILIAANGITGVAEELTRADFEIATGLAAGVRGRPARVWLASASRDRQRMA